MKHCVSFEPFDVWVLYDTDKFTNRKLMLGRCPQCLKYIATLIEKRISDNKIFHDSVTGFSNIEKLCEKVRHQIIYTQQELNIKNKNPYGFVYGINKENKNKKGEVTSITQSACDWFGNKQKIKSIKI